MTNCPGSDLESCGKRASYGFTKPEYCFRHKQDGMSNVRSKKCVDCDKIPSYGYEGKSKTHCIEHKLQGMIPLGGKKRFCNYEGCNRQSIYGYITDKELTHCGDHKKAGMLTAKMKEVFKTGLYTSEDAQQLRDLADWLEQQCETAKRDTSGIVYIVQLPEHRRCNDNVYKIGKTTRSMSERLRGYPKGTTVIETKEVEDCHRFESSLIDVFDTKFTVRLDIGREYYEGDIESMCGVFIAHEK